MNFLAQSVIDILSSADPKCVCDPIEQHGHRFSSFIGENFKICAYTPRDITGFWFGIINIIIWLFAQSPQLLETYKKKSGGAISWSFLIIWLVGDVCNLLGSLFTSQKLLLYTAIYFIIMDGLVLGQIIYYETFYKWAKKKEQEKKEAANADVTHANEKSPLSPGSPHHYGGAEGDEHNNITLTNSKPKTPQSTRTSAKLTSPKTAVMITIVIIALSSIDLTSAASNVLTNLQSFNIQNIPQQILQILTTANDIPICDAPTTNSKVVKIIGVVCAWVCGMLYLTARIPQCWKIYKEKNRYGISFALFAMSFAANCFYAMSILLPQTTNFRSLSFWRDTFPYLIGSLGANIFSLIVMIQFFIYPAIPPKDDNQDAPSSDVDHHHTDLHSIDQHLEVKESHDHTTCPPHHNHNIGTGQIGELALEISPTHASIVDQDTPGSSIQHE